MTSHLPHSDFSDFEYEAAESRVDQAVKEAKQNGQYAIVGVDANAVDGQQSIHDSRRMIGRWGLQSRNERGTQFVAWLHIVRLVACNTMFQKPFAKQWTHQLCSTSAQRQIYFILLDNRLRDRLSDAGASDDIDFKSDHRCVYARLTGSTGWPANQRCRKPHCKGRELEVGQFHTVLDVLLTNSPRDARSLAEGVVAAATAASSGQ